MPAQRTFSGTANTTPNDVLDISGKPAVGFTLSNKDGTNTIRVQVNAVHGTDPADFDYVLPNQTKEWVSPNGRITQVLVKAAAGTAAYVAGVSRGDYAHPTPG